MFTRLLWLEWKTRSLRSVKTRSASVIQLYNPNVHENIENYSRVSVQSSWSNWTIFKIDHPTVELLDYIHFLIIVYCFMMMESSIHIMVNSITESDELLQKENPMVLAEPHPIGNSCTVICNMPASVLLKLCVEDKWTLWINLFYTEKMIQRDPATSSF